MHGTQQWRANRVRVEHEFRTIWQTKGLGRWIPPWKLTQNLAFRKLGNAGKTLWMELAKAEMLGYATLGRIQDTNIYFMGIHSVRFSDISLFDRGAIPTLDGFINGRRQDGKIRTLRTLERIWHTAGFQELVDSKGEVYLKFNQALRDKTHEIRRRSDEKRAWFMYSTRKHYPASWSTKPTPEGLLPPMELPSANKNA